MSIRFLHMADLHLGYRQYHLKERAQDIARAFVAGCRAAVDQSCDFILVAGDLFHGGVDATTFLQAIWALPHDIPLCVIPGNHDRPKSGETLGWLHALSRLRDVTVLEIGLEHGELNLDNAIWETDEVRVIGIPYIGTGLRELLPQVAGRCEAYHQVMSDLRRSRKYTILMMHAGIEGEMPNFRQALTMEGLEPLKDKVDYVALGHLHGAFQKDNWVFNPGSPEVLSVDGIQHQGGWYIVDVDGLDHQVEFVPYAGRRPFLLLRWPVDAYESPERLCRDIGECLMSDAELGTHPQKALIEFRFTGHLQFGRRALDTGYVKRMLTELFNPLRCHIRDMTTTDEAEIDTDKDISRAELEHEVLMGLVARDHEQHAEAWADAIAEIKEQALQKAPPDDLAALVLAFRQHIEGEP